MNKSRALVLGITSGVVICCGVVMGVLLFQLAVTLLEGAAGIGVDSKYSSIKNIEAGPVWVVGVVYVFPGTLCFIAAFVQNKCLYITSCIFAMISIVIMGLTYVFVSLPILLILSVFHNLTKDCFTDTYNCKCRYDTLDYQDMPFKDCSYMTDFLALGISLGVIMIVAWVALLVAFVMACVYACRSKNTTGTVFTPAQQPMLQG